jgi:uncharacterized protein (TIGR02099 family)
MLVLAILFTSLRFISPYLETHHRDFENFVSDLMRQPVSIGVIAMGNRGLEPVLKLYDVSVLNDAKTKVLLQAHELQIGIDLIGSLVKWSIRPGLLAIRGFTLLVYQDKSGGVNVSGIKKTLGNSDVHTDSGSNEIFEWLFDQGKIDLRDAVLIWKSADGKILKFTDLRLKLYNGVLQHDLKVSGRFIQEHKPAKFNVNIKVRGNVLKRSISSLTGDVIIEDWFAKLPQNFSGGNSSVPQSVIPQSGDINLQFKNQRITSSLLRQSLLIDKLGGKIIWKNSKDKLNVSINKFKCMDDWLFLRGRMKFLFPNKDSAPIVDMRLEYKLETLAKAKLYYPASLMPSTTIAWLDQAFVSSKPMDGVVILQGPLDKFPFDNDEGSFLADSNIRDVLLNYDSDWPPVENLTGKLIFANRTMTILAKQAKIVGVPVKSIKAVIPDLDMPVLGIDSDMYVDSSVGLKFVNLSPLKKTIGRKLQEIKLTGPMRLVLNMILPLGELAEKQENKVNGQITLHDNYLQPYGFDFGVENLQGELSFTEDDLLADTLRGELFGNPVSMDIGTLVAKDNANDTITRVTLAGKVEVNKLEQAFSIKLNPYVAGDFKYQALLELHSVAKESVFKLSSNLQGLTIDLPQPFSKTTTGASKFDLAYYFGGSKLPRAIINYNNQINAALASKQTKPKAIIGEIKFGAEPASISVDSGLIISGKIKKLDWSVWRDYLFRAKNSFTKGAGIVWRLNLNIGELHALGQKLKKVMLQASPKNNGWEIGVSMSTIKGKIFFPKSKDKQIQGVFQRFYFDIDKKQQNMLMSKPQDLLPLHFIINDFRYENTRFDKVEIITEHVSNGLKINKIAINDPKFSLVASGSWLMLANKQQSILRGKISSGDIGDLLKQFKLTDNLVGGKGEADFDLKWPSAPYNPALKEVVGSFVIRANNGNIINLSKQTERQLGFGKVLNMLSLRHLSLDFSDLTKKGFGFDKMYGDFKLNKEGNALVKNIILDGPIAQVKANGRIGLVAQDYNIRLSTTPHVTSSIPVVAAIATANPLVGLLSWFVADKMIAPGIKKVTTYIYHVTGSWDQPVLQRVKSLQSTTERGQTP